MADELWQKIKQFTASKEVNLIGVAESKDFKDAPPGHKPTDLLSDAKAVIVMAIRMPRGVAKLIPSHVYLSWYYTVNRRLDEVALELAMLLESEGYIAIPIPASEPYNLREELNLPAAISHRHAAHLAGLGIIGKNQLLVTREYGPRVRLVSVVTNAPLKSTKKIEKEDFCRECRKCIDACPAKALEENGYIDKRKCVRYMEKLRDEMGVEYADVCGICIKACPVGEE